MGWKLGFGIAIVIVAIFVAILVFSQMPTGLGSATNATMAPGFMRAIKIGAAPDGLVPAASGFGAGTLYQQAYQAVKSLGTSSRALRHIDQNSDPAHDSALAPILALIEKAAGKRLTSPHLRFHTAPPLPKVTDMVERRLEAMGDITAQAGEAYQVANHPKKALAAFAAGLSFGHRLWKKGLFIPERTVGLDSVETSLEAMESLYEKGPLKNMRLQHTVLKLDRRVKAALTTWNAKYQIVHSISPDAADMINIIRHDRDISWRIAALTSLGVARWTTSKADKAHAILTFLHRESLSSNAWISEAAKQAAAFTRTTMNSLSD